ARTVVAAAVSSGIAIPAFTAALSYFDTFRSGRMPSNLIQAQRDYFGAHTYERVDKEGVFHTQWFAK
ncbi:MAG TPA: NADP-dependent phosphogluconate dehydrogenase, partial [Chryseolinea sp.]